MTLKLFTNSQNIKILLVKIVANATLKIMYASPSDRNKSSISTTQLSTAHTHCYLYLGEKVCDSLLTPSEQLFQQYHVRIKFI
jgi:hypothetical protein